MGRTGRRHCGHHDPQREITGLAHLADRLGFEESITAPIIYKDEHLSPELIRAALRRAGMTGIETFYDSPGWFWLLDLDRTPMRRFTPAIARWLRVLEGSRIWSRLLCDQVKFKATVSKPGAQPSAPEWVGPDCRKELTRDECERCGTAFARLDEDTTRFVDSEPMASPPPASTRAQRGRYRAAFLIHTVVYAPLLLLARAMSGGR